MDGSRWYYRIPNSDPLRHWGSISKNSLASHWHHDHIDGRQSLILPHILSLTCQNLLNEENPTSTSMFRMYERCWYYCFQISDLVRYRVLTIRISSVSHWDQRVQGGRKILILLLKQERWYMSSSWFCSRYMMQQCLLNDEYLTGTGMFTTH